MVTTARDALRSRGILDAEGGLTEAGAELRRSIEAATDTVALAPWRLLKEERTIRLGDIGRDFSRQVAACGVFPAGVFAEGSVRSGVEAK